MPPVLRPAQKNDYSALYSFSNSLNYLHRHLDWRDSLEWLGRDPFWVMEEKGELQAVLACPPEPAEVAWVRLFGATMHTSPDRAWKKLFEPTLAYLQNVKPVPAITSLALRDWFEDLIKRNGFRHYQDIVVFIFDTDPPAPRKMSAEFQLREMQVKDLHDVARIDHLAFEPIWRLSTDDLLFAAKKSALCTVIEQNNQIVAYQMTSTSGMYAHLARLAVDPKLQQQGLGFAMVQHLLDHFINHKNLWGVTLNTQNDNSASIRLYHKVGFRETGERFPVYRYAA
jgi:ribosomal protein S18 acetylase RimI-like enzyme